MSDDREVIVTVAKRVTLDPDHIEGFIEGTYNVAAHKSITVTDAATGEVLYDAE